MSQILIVIFFLINGKYTSKGECIEKLSILIVVHNGLNVYHHMIKRLMNLCVKLKYVSIFFRVQIHHSKNNVYFMIVVNRYKISL